MYIGKHVALLNISVVVTVPYTVVVTWISPVTGSQYIDHCIVTVFNEIHNTLTLVNTTNNITSLTIYGLVKFTFLVWSLFLLLEKVSRPQISASY